MHAVVVRVNVPNVEETRPQLVERVVPAVAAQPGFVAGYWLEPKDDQGLSVAVFDSEDAARTAAENVRPPEGVTVVSVEVREVVASA
jgi:heme-degrading monooxygenase HmoA